jgi:hypothetical protein
MGGGQSFPIKLSSVRQEAPFPTIDPIGIGKGMAEGCQSPTGGVCQLAIAAGVSASGAKLYREMGSITREKCKKYGDDADKVRANKMAFEEFRKGLLDGVYYRDLGNEYCGQVLYDAADLDKVSKIEELDASKARMPIIRKVSSSGGFSSITKAFIKPSIPFEVEFNSKPHKINVLTLMHPSPIRVENVQHDAMLTLGDPGEGNNDGLVILVPLVGSLTAGASGAFIAKIARYMSGILTPNPATGQYESIDIPTGSDWKLSSIFPGAPGEGGKTFVKSPGYYVWSGQPPLDLKLIRTDVKRDRIFGIWERGNTDNYAWSETGNPGIRYVMLSQPVQVNSMDLQTILMLPSTPITEAVSPMVKSTLSYRKAGSIGPDGRWVTECPRRLPALTNFFGGTTESFEDTCDPFAPGSFPSTAPDTNSLVTLVIGLVGAVGVFLAIYFAVKLWTQMKPGRWVADKGEWFGNMVAQFSIADARKRLAPAGVFKVSREEEKRMADEAAAAEKAEKKAADEAEARLAAPAITPVTDEEKAARRTKPKPKKEDTDMEKAAEASIKQKEAEDAADAKTKAEDAKRKADDEAYDAAEELKRAAEEELLRRNGPAGTGLELTDEQLASNLDVERARIEAEERARLEADSAQLAPQGRPNRKTRTRVTTPTAGPSAIDRALAKKKEADTAKLQAQADATNALFAEAKARKEKEEAEAKEAVESEIQKEKAKLEAADEARIKAEAERVAASASDVASKTLKRRNIQSSDRALVPRAVEARPPAPPAASDSVDTIRKRVFDLEASILRQSTYLKGNPPGPNEPNRIRFETLEKRLLSALKDLHATLEAAESRAGDLPPLEKMALLKLVKDKRALEKKELEAQKKRFDLLKIPIPTANVIKGGRRKRLKRKSTRRYVA